MELLGKETWKRGIWDTSENGNQENGDRVIRRKKNWKKREIKETGKGILRKRKLWEKTNREKGIFWK